MKTPYVSCIMPTANRENFIPLAVSSFLNQDYRNVELVIIDDGKRSVKNLIPDHHRIKYYYTSPLGTIGQKRNYACDKANGEIIMHWDDDDWYAYDWISKQLSFLETSKADLCGLNNIIFFSPLVGKFWRYHDPGNERPFIAGATMAYGKKFWEKHPFKDLQIGEDYDYVWNSGASIFAHDYTDGFIATLHARNTTLKPFENPKHKLHAIQWMNIPFNGKRESEENKQ
ncbi:glycosyltransferase family A protein [Pedobacter sp. L105]|uniref:glycosyltransferase family 2 protein n=1 Tax=Pedobacter sp. L105 TaxID=1641871 RepID=UPI00131B5376|nr:glycosyltransferase family A protein [Pedobacter sp. L105]